MSYLSDRPPTSQKAITSHYPKSDRTHPKKRSLSHIPNSDRSPIPKKRSHSHIPQKQTDSQQEFVEYSVNVSNADENTTRNLRAGTYYIYVSNGGNGTTSPQLSSATFQFLSPY